MRDAIRRFGPVVAVDLVGLSGLAALVRGVQMIYPPAAWILAGAAAVAWAVLASRRLM